MEKLSSSEGWFELAEWRVNQYRLSAEGTIVAHGARYPIRLIYPDQFPLVPPWVEPQNPEAWWTIHQYGRGGPLCLELRPDNWTPTATGADMLRSAYNLLHVENPLGEGEHDAVPSAAHIGEIQSYDWGLNPVLIGESCLRRLCAGAAEDLQALRWMADENVWPIFISDAADRATVRRPPSSDVGTWRFNISMVVAMCDPPSDTPATRSELACSLGVDLCMESLTTGPLLAIAVGSERVVPYHVWPDSSVYRRSLIELPDQTGLRSGRRASAAGKGVAIVGLGSVGSKVAEMLLRSGVDRLVLIDGDVFLPANLERHILDWRDVGQRKVHAVRRHLLHIAPGANIQVVARNFNWQTSAKMHATDIDTVSECDLIIDATGHPPSSLMLAALAGQNGQPFVSVEIFEGGIGALIARAIPGRDASYISGRNAYAAYCAEKNVRPPETGRRAYEALTELGEPFVADDAAVSIGSSHATRIALDILDDNVGAADTAWLLLGFRAGWLFQRHGECIALDVGPPDISPSLPISPEDGACIISWLETLCNAATPSK